MRAITTTEAAAIITEYEWLGTMPAVSRHCFGIFFDGELGGAVVYGDEYGESLGGGTATATAAGSSRCCVVPVRIGRIRIRPASSFAVPCVCCPSATRW